MPKTHELLNALVPTRMEKRRVGRAMGYKDEQVLYRWCEDPEESGRPNPLDKLMVLVENGLIHHPDAAIATAQFVTHEVAARLVTSAEHLPVTDLVLALQPATERESLDVAAALSRALRQMLLGGKVDAPALLQEIDEAVGELTKTAVMLRASLHAEASRA